MFYVVKLFLVDVVNVNLWLNRILVGAQMALRETFFPSDNTCAEDVLRDRSNLAWLFLSQADKSRKFSAWKNIWE